MVRREPPDSSSLPADTAFLLSDAHVTAMLQCLEAVEQNNPRLLAQIDTSMVS